MGHLIRFRESAIAVSELTKLDISPMRKKQLTRSLARAEKIADQLKEDAEGKGLRAILARTLYLNIVDYISKIRETRFVKTTVKEARPGEVKNRLKPILYPAVAEAPVKVDLKIKPRVY